MLHSKEKIVNHLGRDEGYTLLELLVVLVIVTLIIGIAGPVVLRQFGTAKTSTARVEVNRLVNSLEFFNVDTQRFPTQEEGLQALLTAPDGLVNWNGPYLPKASQLIDPWGREYVYSLAADGATVIVSTLGADGAEGGSGENEDVSSQD